MARASQEDCPYVSRGGLKLAAALDAFGLDPTGLVCADLGCSTGGFTDCLLQHGARHVFSVDTAYGELAWKLRQDERVTVLERTNAVHFNPRDELSDFAGCDLVVLDLGWTRQARAIPAALRWLKANDPAARIITLIKPHYEASNQAMAQRRPGRARFRGRAGGKKGKSQKAGVLDDEQAERVLHEVLDALPALGVEPLGHVASPIRGGKGGNLEYLALLRVKGNQPQMNADEHG